MRPRTLTHFWEVQRLPCVRGAGTRSVTEGLPPQFRFPPMFTRCRRSPEYGSVLQVSSVWKTMLLTGGSGIGWAAIFTPDRSFLKLNQIPTAQVNPSVSLRSTAPFTQGSLFLNFTNALLFHTGAAQNPSVGATHAVARFPGFCPCPTRAVGSTERSKKAPPWGELPPKAAEGGTTALKASAAGTKGPVRSPAAVVILRCCRRPPSASLRSAPPPEGEAFTEKRSGIFPGAFSMCEFT